MVSIVPITVDSRWINNSFLLPRHAANLTESQNRVYSTAYQKFTNTTLGGSYCLNPLPQHTIYADPGVGIPGVGIDTLGRRYSEMQDDNAEIIHVRCGVRQTVSMFTFYTSFYDYELDRLVKTGQSPGIMYTISKVLGFVVSLPIQPLIFVGKLVKFLITSGSSAYASLRPTMPPFWNTATTILNQIMINEGSPPIISNKRNLATDFERGNVEYRKSGFKDADGNIMDMPTAADVLKTSESDDPGTTAEDIESIYNYQTSPTMVMEMGELFSRSGGIDLYAVASRATRTANNVREKFLKQIESISELEEYNATKKELYIKAVKDARGTGFTMKSMDDDGVSITGLAALLSGWNNDGNSNITEAPPNLNKPTDGQAARRAARSKKFKEAKKSSNEYENSESFFTRMSEYFGAELRDGGAFVSLRVNNSGTVSESFSSSTAASNVKEKFNNLSSATASKKYDFSDGNVSGGLIKEVLGTVRDVVMGAAAAVSLDGLGAVFGSAYMDIPDRYDGSSASLPSMTYTIQLRSLYEDPISRAISIWAPLSVILAMSLPRSVGANSYDSPFLCEVYNRGKAQSRYAIPESVSISRGEGDLAFSANKKPLGINVDITFKDLGSIAHMSVATHPGVFDSHSIFGDYMAVLGGLSLSDQIYGISKLKLNFTKMYNSVTDKYTSPAYYGQWGASTAIGSLLASASRGTDLL